MDDSTAIEGSGDLAYLYDARFSARETHDKQVLWSTLCRSWLQRYVPVDGTVLDLGAGHCEFINEIRAQRKIAVDLNPETGLFARQGVEVFRTPSTHLTEVEDACVDTVFTSNFFEHLPDKVALMQTLRETSRVLRPGGRIVVLMPNIRYVGGRYWDFLDHYLPLTHVSLTEALSLAGFEAEEVIPRFLPYTVKNAKVPVRAVLIRLYLRLPLAWRFMGGQMFVVARVSS